MKPEPQSARKWGSGLETAEPIRPEEFEKALAGIRLSLLKAQSALRERARSIVVIVYGYDGAGKGEVIRKINEWLDPRGIDTHSFWDPSTEESERPDDWRFWRALPRRGRIALWFGGWYLDPLKAAVQNRMSGERLLHEIAAINATEKALVADGTVFLKLWLHLSKQEQADRLKDLYRQPEKHWRAMPEDWNHHRIYHDYATAAKTLLDKSDTDWAPWSVVSASIPHWRDLTVARLLLKTAKTAAKKEKGKALLKAQAAFVFKRVATAAKRDFLGKVDLSARLRREEYEQELIRRQAQVHRLFWRAYEKKLTSILVFEGWDAAGKGGAIRRVTAAIDARLVRTVNVAAPTSEEHAYHYLWRFWRDLPRAGRITIFDRSWYGRVLVERVEGFASETEWQRAYEEINAFEKRLIESGNLLIKFWLHLSYDRQLQRFKERERVPQKQHKINQEDWRNRRRWPEYETAVNEMIARTDRAHAPWILVAGNNKRFARIQVLGAIRRHLERRFS